MGTGVFGRTNQAFPPIWLSLAVPADSDELGPMVQAAVAANTVVDVSNHPGLFGGFMRGSEGLVMGAGGSDIAGAADEDSAANLIHAHLIETLSAIGREWLDLYFLRLRKPLEEFQITGALRALDWAKDEGHVKFVGLSAEANPAVVVGTWQFHDAFDTILLPAENDSLANMAAEHRVGVVTRGIAEGTSLVTVRSRADIAQAMEAALAPR